VDHAADLIDDAAIVSVPHVSNTLGTIDPVGDLATPAHDHGAYLLVDGARSVPTRPVDVGEIGCDFLAFSGHKMAGPTGIGGLYGRRELLEEMEPFPYGGEMIRSVTLGDASWNELPWKFEAGTPPIAEGVALAAAADYLDGIGVDAVREREAAVADPLADELEGAPVSRLAELDGVVDDLPDGRYPDLRRDCVVGPEDVLREAAREYPAGSRDGDGDGNGSRTGTGTGEGGQPADAGAVRDEPKL